MSPCTHRRVNWTESPTACLPLGHARATAHAHNHAGHYIHASLDVSLRYPKAACSNFNRFSCYDIAYFFNFECPSGNILIVLLIEN